ncbi:MAG: membrane protein insertion efficiency factor YidD [Candidatus Yanofskybacteria bacterium RIFCSPHIGHO2_01_FULL_39_44]|nr:MAG: membrane protein insertion efficiency factor YidD [Candidatus Yanofskybacteria bacterium RIFCSPHIGHO2_01_FULL_39_44]
MKKTVIKFIKGYQYFSHTLLRHNALPLFFPSVCRFYPSCSEYTIEMIDKCGLWKGLLKGLNRILKCNPLTTNYK